jgi:hypothetical protein
MYDRAVGFYTAYYRPVNYKRDQEEWITSDSEKKINDMQCKR